MEKFCKTILNPNSEITQSLSFSKLKILVQMWIFISIISFFDKWIISQILFSILILTVILQLFLLHADKVQNLVEEAVAIISCIFIFFILILGDFSGKPLNTLNFLMTEIVALFNIFYYYYKYEPISQYEKLPLISQNTDII